MERPLPEVLASQGEMLRRRGTSSSVGQDFMAAAFTKHLKEVQAWLNKRQQISVCAVAYGNLVRDPLATTQTVRDFLALDLNVEAMILQVDPSLYRNRRS
jgi:hypothetical protein